MGSASSTQQVANSGIHLGTVRTNDYIDSLIRNAQAEMLERGLDPFELPDQDLRVFGELRLYDGQIVGLSSVERDGDAYLEVASDSLLLCVTLKASNVYGVYRWKKRVLFFKLKGTVEASIGSISAHAKIRQRTTGGSHAELVEFTVSEPEDLIVDIVGLKPFNSMMEGVVETKLREMKGVMESEARDLIIKNLTSITFPSI